MANALKKIGFLHTKKAWVFLLLCVDVVATSLAFLSALFLRQNEVLDSYVGQAQVSVLYVHAFIFSLVLLIFIYALHGLYEFKNLKRINEIVLLSKSAFVWLIALMAGAYLYKYDFSRIIVVSFGVLSFLYGFLGRQLLQKFRTYLLAYGIGHVRVIIVGKGRTAKDVETSLRDYYGEGMFLVGMLAPLQTDGKYSISVEELSTLAAQHASVEVYIAEPQFSHEYILEIASRFSLPHIQFKIVADIFSLATGSFKVTNIDEIPVLDFQKAAPSWVFRYTKRIFDIFASCFFAVLSSPLWLIVAVLIKLDSPGPVFISQMRIGYKGKPFLMWKFRTMHAGTPLYETGPQKSKDPRITRFGAFLRRTSLDELPQLINVFKGDMSMVGPRPEMQFIVEKYTPWQKKRLEAKPGITGLWQILGRKDLPLVENLQYDFYYINNQSLFLDFVILLKTVPVVLWGRGAY